MLYCSAVAPGCSLCVAKINWIMCLLVKMNTNVCPCVPRTVHMWVRESVCVCVCVCVRTCVCGGGCFTSRLWWNDNSLRPDGWVMHYVWETSLLCSAHSRNHFKTKNTLRCRYQTLRHKLTHTTKWKLCTRPQLTWGFRILHMQPLCTAVDFA